MNILTKTIYLVAAISSLLVHVGTAAEKNMNISERRKHFGMCDASAAVFLDPNHFAVANDEDNVLRVFKAHESGNAVQTFELSEFLGVKRGSEADFEAAATIGNTTFWIGSHGRNKKGKEALSRRKLLATKFISRNGVFGIEHVGSTYNELLGDLLRDPKLDSLGLKTASELPPKSKGGLNIEGLCATPEGHLLVAFRNPIPKGKALIVPLLNPLDLIEGKRAKLGEPILLELGGLGIRDIASFEKKYLILAGPFDGGADSHLYDWDGKTTLRKLGGLQAEVGANPEAILVHPQSREVLVLTDNGGASIEGVDCKELDAPEKKFFQSFTVKLD